MAALYRVWRDQAYVDLAGLAGKLLKPLGMAGQPAGAACLAVARAVTQWGGLPYHSVQHHAEVAMNLTVLTELAALAGRPLPVRDRALLLAASLAHDYGYQPGGKRFAAEAASAQAMDAIGAEYGVATVDREDIASLILATEPGFRTVLSGAPPPADLPPPLHALLARPDLVAMAATLSDADLLSSAGLTPRWHQVQNGRLEREYGRAIAPAENVAFFDRIVGPRFLSAGGQHLTPNLVRIRAACVRQPRVEP